MQVQVLRSRARLCCLRLRCLIARWSGRPRARRPATPRFHAKTQVNLYITRGLRTTLTVDITARDARHCDQCINSMKTMLRSQCMSRHVDEQRAQQSQRATPPRPAETQPITVPTAMPASAVQPIPVPTAMPASAAQPITVTPTNSTASGPKREETQATARYCTVHEPAKIRAVRDRCEGNGHDPTYGPGEVTRTPLPDIHRIS